jgi:MoaA/NifB/PqqE/SkfB family radical SAM enzyme
MHKVFMKKVACIRPWYSIFNYRETKVCCWQQTNIGKLDGITDFEDIWNSPAAQKLRRDMLDAPEGTVPSEHCPPYCHNKQPSELFRPEYRELVEQEMTVIPLPPVEIAFIVDHICNLRCKMCWIFDDPEYSISVPGLKNMLDYSHLLSKDAKPSVVFIGGEPFFSKNSKELIGYVADKLPKMRFGCITNMTIWDDKLLTSLMSSEISHWDVSFDGGTKEAYEHIRKNAVFEKTFENLEKLCMYRYERTKIRGREDWPITIGSIVMTSSYKTMCELIELLWELPVQLHFVPISYSYRPTTYEQVFTNKSLWVDLEVELKKAQTLALKKLSTIDEWNWRIPLDKNVSAEEIAQIKKQHTQFLVDSLDLCLKYLDDMKAGRVVETFDKPAYDVDVSNSGQVHLIKVPASL